jgi:hypothetical protein
MMLKKQVYIIAFLLFVHFNFAQNHAQTFWDHLKQHCDQAYNGTITQAPENDSFRGKKLVMHVRHCEENLIKIPFFVGDDKSRTWVLTFSDGKIKLKHDHRHEDGSEDKITQYGGESTHSGLASIQFFPADEQTCQLIDYACMNVWYITLDEKSFTYNLRRMGTDRMFSVSFDLTKTVEKPSAPWGHE